jgi:hypothetical protein
LTAVVGAAPASMDGREGAHNPSAALPFRKFLRFKSLII